MKPQDAAMIAQALRQSQPAPQRERGSGCGWRALLLPVLLGLPCDCLFILFLLQRVGAK
jgi:hypothetical protein